MEDNKNKNFETETDFKEILKNPMRWYGLVFPFFIAVIVLGGLYFVVNMGTFYVNNIKPLPVNEEHQKQPIQKKKGITLEGVNIMEISKPNPELIDKGKELFQANCASCHGDNGMGDGVAGKSLDPAPRNFHSSEGWVNGRKISDMYKTIEEGIDGSGMVAYDYLPVRDRFAMIHYIRTFADDYPEDTEDELAMLDQTYSLSQGKETPNSIPIELAMEKVLSENEFKIASLHKIQSKIKSDESSEAMLFKHNINNCEKALTILQNNNIWRSDYGEFKGIIESGIPYNGFKPSMLDLSEEELMIVKEYLNMEISTSNNNIVNNNIKEVM